MSVNLGRVAYVEKGKYKSDTTYENKDVVSFNGGSYVFIGDTPAANVPPTNEDIWQPLIDPTAMNNKIAELDDVKEEALTAAATANEKAQGATAAADTANAAAQRADEARDNIRAELNGKAPAILVDASGDMVHITDGAAMPVQSLVTHIAPVQSGSGDPSPDNVRQISGWDGVKVAHTGKNIFHVDTITFTRATWINMKNPLLPGTYTFAAGVESGDTDKTQSTAYFYKGATSGGSAVEVGRAMLERGVRNAVTLTFKNTVDSIMLCAGTALSNSDGDTATWTDIQLEYGGTATEFEPYQGQTLTAELPETVYGGELDWTTGVLTVTHKKETITRMSATHSNAGEGYLAASVSKLDMKSDSRDNGLCETMKSVRSHVGATSNCIVFGASNQTLYIAISTELAGTTRDSLNAYLAENPLTVVYPLAEPYTIQLTPQQLSTLKGTNNIWSNAGQTEVAYAADTKIYIDQKIAAIAAAIV